MKGQLFIDTEGNISMIVPLRDQFAMAALTGLLAMNWGDDYCNAERAYEAADAMLKRRESK